MYMSNRRQGAAGAVACFLLGATLCAIAPGTLTAQLSGTSEGAPLGVSEEIRQAHMVHVSPHVLVFTPNSKTATIELSNQGKTPVSASVVVELGYTVWANPDTALFTTHAKEPRAHDTVVVNPRPQDRYAGRWLSGYPTSVTLAPREKKRVTLRINPPAGLPDGEYYARLVTIVAPPTKKPADSKAKDVRTVYKLPVTGVGIQTLRDSVRIFYRTGKVMMGLRLFNGKAELDPKKASGVSTTHREDVWTMFNFENTGNAQVQGAMSVVCRLPSGEEFPLTVDPGNIISVYGKGTMRWYAQLGPLPRGRYSIIVKIGPYQNEFPVDQRIPMTPAEISMPFEVH
jgi:hypothetical protein